MLEARYVTFQKISSNEIPAILVLCVCVCVCVCVRACVCV